MRPRVSVVTSVHNGEAYLQAAIDSILAQTFTDFEFLIIDDGSTDATPRILRDVAARDRRITGITQPHLGISVSLNRGTDLARGIYIARQDADDISLPTRLAKQVDFLDRHLEIAMVGSWIKLIDAHGSYMVDVQHPIDHQTLSAALPTHNCFTHGSLLIRRAALVEVGGYRVEFRLCEDYDLFLRMVERFSVANLPEILYLYRRSGYSTTSQLASQMGHFMEAARELARQRRARGKEVLMAGVTMR